MCRPQGQLRVRGESQTGADGGAPAPSRFQTRRGGAVCLRPPFLSLVSCDLLDLKKADVGSWCLINAHRNGACRPRRDAAGRRSRRTARRPHGPVPDGRVLAFIFLLSFKETVPKRSAARLSHAGTSRSACFRSSRSPLNHCRLVNGARETCGEPGHGDPLAPGLVCVDPTRDFARGVGKPGPGTEGARRSPRPGGARGAGLTVPTSGPPRSRRLWPRSLRPSTSLRCGQMGTTPGSLL